MTPADPYAAGMAAAKALVAEHGDIPEATARKIARTMKADPARLLGITGEPDVPAREAAIAGAGTVPATARAARHGLHPGEVKAS